MQVADYTVDYMLYCLHHKNKQEMLLSVSVNETFFLNPTQTVENQDERVWSCLGEQRRLQHAGLSWACVCLVT